MSACGDNGGPQVVTVCVTRHDEPDGLLMDALNSLARQTGVDAIVMVLDQAPSQKIADCVAQMGGDHIRFEYHWGKPCGLSVARNRVFRECQSDIVLFLDVDAVAEPDWAASLTQTLASGSVAVVGGKIIPRWPGHPPPLHRSQFILEQYSCLDLGPEEIPASKVIGASFGLRLDLLGADAYFDESLGRRDGRLHGGEETDLCTRVLAKGLSVRYNGRAVIEHRISKEKTSFSWLLRKLYYAGVDRCARGGRPAPTHRLCLFDYLFLPFILPIYAFGYLAERSGLRHN